jgi:cytoskeleton protein RodZ
MADSEQAAAYPASAPEADSVGQILRRARVARDLSLEQVSAELRIEPQQLDALEHDRFERIGVPVFVKGYLRQYGVRLGLDPRELLAQYDRQTKLRDVEIQPSKTIKLHDERQITVWVVAVLVLLALIVGLATWWLNGGGFTLSGTPATVEKTAPAAGPTPSAPQAAQTDAAASQPSPAADSAAAVPVSASTQPPQSAPRDAAAAAAVVPPATAPAPPSSPPVLAGPNAAVAEEPDRGPYIVALDVTFDQESWAEINDARGERLFYGLGAAGRKEQLRGEPPFAIVLGNSAGVRLTLDGQDYPVPTSGRPGDSARFTVDIVEE